MAQTVDVRTELLEWAVNRSGRAIDEFSPLVKSWLSGDRKPTHSQLEGFAKKAMVPLGYLFLDDPPNESLPLPDFRTRKDKGIRTPTPNLIETIFEMQRRQEWMREYLLEESYEPLPFVGSVSIGEELTTVASAIRKTLGLEENWAASRSSWEEALRLLRERIEAAGILIFFNGIVGNNTRRKLDPDEFQGFVLVDDVVPLVFVNGADYKAAQMFTIAHELAHVWIGQSALFDFIATRSADIEVETYCNKIAAEFLVPAGTFVTAWSNDRDLADQASRLARRFKVSTVVIMRRALDFRLISADQFFAFYNRYMAQERTRASSGGNFWSNQTVRLGKRFGRAVITAAREGRLSYTDAYNLTRLYGETFSNYARRLQNEVN
jgi:Zn-dependent peptidase ImmA (M78 family)